MKRYISSAILTALLGLSTIAFADGHNITASIEDVKKETKELLQTINSYGSDKKDELLKKSKKSLEKLDSRIDELESKVAAYEDEQERSQKESDESFVRFLMYIGIGIAGLFAITYITHLLGQLQDNKK